MMAPGATHIADNEDEGEYGVLGEEEGEEEEGEGNDEWMVSCTSVSCWDSG